MAQITGRLGSWGIRSTADHQINRPCLHSLHPRHRRRRRGCWGAPLLTPMPGDGETLRRPTPSTQLMMPAPLRLMMDSAWSACPMGAPRWGALLAAGDAAYANHRWHPLSWCVASALHVFLVCAARMWVARCRRCTSRLHIRTCLPSLVLQVWVHIADPSRWVAPGSPLAQEAEVRRGRSGLWFCLGDPSAGESCTRPTFEGSCAGVCSTTPGSPLGTLN